MSAATAMRPAQLHGQPKSTLVGQRAPGTAAEGKVSGWAWAGCWAVFGGWPRVSC
jgi:hypothetical protein